MSGTHSSNMMKLDQATIDYLLERGDLTREAARAATVKTRAQVIEETRMKLIERFRAEGPAATQAKLAARLAAIDKWRTAERNAPRDTAEDVIDRAVRRTRAMMDLDRAAGTFDAAQYRRVIAGINEARAARSTLTTVLRVGTQPSSLIDSVKILGMDFADMPAGATPARSITLICNDKLNRSRWELDVASPSTTYDIIRSALALIDTTRSQTIRGSVIFEFANDSADMARVMSLASFLRYGSSFKRQARLVGAHRVKHQYKMRDLREGAHRAEWEAAIDSLFTSIDASFTTASVDDDGNKKYTWRIEKIRVYLNAELPAAGGCSKNRSNKGETIALRLHGAGEVVIHAPKDRDSHSGGNNCAIHAIRYILATQHDMKIEQTADQIRAEAGLPRGSLIGCTGDAAVEMEALITAFERITGASLEVSIDAIELMACANPTKTRKHGAKSDTIAAFPSGVENALKIDLAIMGIGKDAGHYYAVKSRSMQRIKCNECGRMYAGEHTCNPSVRDFYRTMVHGEAPMLSFNQRKYVHEEPFALNEAYVYDLETFFPGGEQNVAARVYAVGLRRLGQDEHGAEYPRQFFYGEGAIGELAQVMIRAIEAKQPMTLIAHNGSRFDNLFVLREMIRQGHAPSGKGYLKSGNSLLVCSWGKVRLWDTYRVLNASLAKLAEDFRLPIQKGEFDHDKIRSYADAEEHREEVLRYLQGDIDVLAAIFIKHNEAVFDRWGFYATDYITGPSMAYALFRRSVVDQGIAVYAPEPKQTRAVRKSIYGGRVTPWRTAWESSIADEIRQAKEAGDTPKLAMLYKRAKENRSYMIPADICSLYPFAQSDVIVPGIADEPRAYPCGKAKLIDTPADAEAAFRAGIPGFYYVSFDAPASLNWPILARKTKSGRIQWSLEPGSGTYSGVELLDAEREGYKLTFVRNDRDNYAGLIYPTRYKRSADGETFTEAADGMYINPFDKVVRDLIQLKTEASKAGQRAKRAISKILVNSVWGSCCYRAPNTKTSVLSSAVEFFAWQRKHELIDWTELSPGSYHVTGNEIDPESDEPYAEPPEKRTPQLASYVLAHSRRIMTNAARIANGGSLHGAYWCISYTDTDSLYLSAEGFERLQAAGLVADENLGRFDNDLKDSGRDPIIYEYYSRGPKSKVVAWVDADGKTGQETTLKGMPLEAAERKKLQCIPSGSVSKAAAASIINPSTSKVDFEAFKQACFVNGSTLKVSYSTMPKVFPRASKHPIDAYAITCATATRSTNLACWEGFKLVDADVGLRPHGWSL